MEDNNSNENILLSQCLESIMETEGIQTYNPNYNSDPSGMGMMMFGLYIKTIRENMVESIKTFSIMLEETESVIKEVMENNSSKVVVKIPREINSETGKMCNHYVWEKHLTNFYEMFGATTTFKIGDAPNHEFFEMTIEKKS